MLSKTIHADIFYFDQKAGYHWPTGRQISFFSSPGYWRDYQILHTHTLRPDLYAAIQKIFGRKIKTITTLHNFFYHEYRLEYPLIPALTGIAVHHLSLYSKDALVAITPEMKAFYQQKGFRNVTYIPNTRILPPPSALINEISQQISFWKADSVLLMTLGTVNERKNLFTLVPLLLNNPDWKWIHVGSGPLFEKLEEQIAFSKLQHRVKLLGYIEEGSALLPVADVLLLPSLSEGFPLVVLEAFQARIPVVVSDLNAYKGLLQSEVIRCRPSDIDNFSRAVSTAIKQKAQLTEAAYKRYKEEFSPAVVCDAYLSLYESIL